MKLKRRWKILIGVGISFVLLAVSLHYPPKHEVDAYKALLRNRGEKLELGEAVPAVLAKDNAAAAMESAFLLLDPNQFKIPRAMAGVAPGKALIGWQQPDARDDDFTNTWDEFAATIHKNQAALDKLHQVLDYPALRFQSGNFDLSKDVFPKFVPTKTAVRVLAAAAILELHDGEPGMAGTNIVTSLALVHKNEADGLEIAHLIRLSMLSITIVPTWELLEATNVTDAQLAAIQSAWEQLNILRDAENAFVVERAWGLAQMKKARGSHKGFKDLFDPPISIGSYGVGGSGSGGSVISDLLDEAQHETRLAIGEALWRSSWTYFDELHVLEFNQVVVETLRMMQTNQSQFYWADAGTMWPRMASLGLTNTSGAISKFLELPDFREIVDLGFDAFLRKTLQMETAKRVVITAIALKRFQLAHGKWPKTLNELAPDIIPTVPIDPFDGKPLKYHLNADGKYLLYSVGKDGVDNGGNPTNSSPNDTSFVWQVGRDWVWPQPATPDEVKGYYEHPRK